MPLLLLFKNVINSVVSLALLVSPSVALPAELVLAFVTTNFSDKFFIFTIVSSFSNSRILLHNVFHVSWIPLRIISHRNMQTDISAL